MATLGIDGLASGLNTTSLINSLMQVEAMPQTMLKQKSSSAQSLVSALQGLNTKVASLAAAAKTASTPSSWQAWQATSSGPAAAAAASPSAQPGSITFSVDAVATSRVVVSRAVADDGSLVSGMPPAVTVKAADGTLVTVQPTTGSLADIAKALNDAADAGVKASVVRVGNGEVPTYRLQFTGTTTGEAGRFEVFAGTAEEVDAGTATSLHDTTVREANKAQVTLWKGVSGLEMSLSQDSNTFSGLLTGVDVTVSAVTASGEDVTVTVGRHDEALAKLASETVTNVNLVLSEIASRTRSSTTTGADGSTRVTGGLFSGDSAIRSFQQQLVEAASRAVDGRSPAEVGIVIGRDGTFTFDEATFTAALAANPAGVEAMVSALAGRVAEVATRASDPTTGTLTQKIKGQEGIVKDLGAQIESWDRRLELRRASLERTYSALEVTLSNLQSQSSWLAGQLAGLPSWSSSSK